MDNIGIRLRFADAVANLFAESPGQRVVIRQRYDAGVDGVLAHDPAIEQRDREALSMTRRHVEHELAVRLLRLRVDERVLINTLQHVAQLFEIRPIVLEELWIEQFAERPEGMPGGKNAGIGSGFRVRNTFQQRRHSLYPSLGIRIRLQPSAEARYLRFSAASL